MIQFRNDPKDAGRNALITSFIFEAIGYTVDPPSIGEAISAWSGIPHATGLIIIVAAILWCVAVIIALSCWHDSPQQRKKTTRVWLCLAAVGVMAVAVVWFRGWLRIMQSLPTSIGTNAADVGAGGWAAATMIIYAVALIVGLVKIRSLCARYANSGQKSWVTRGLRLVRWGAGISFGYACIFLAGVIAQFFGTAIPYWHAVVVPAVLTSTILGFAGFALPSLGPALVDIRRNLADMRAHRALKPLWEDLVLDNPHIALRESAADLSGRARTAARQLHRARAEKPPTTAPTTTPTASLPWSATTRTPASTRRSAGCASLPSTTPSWTRKPTPPTFLIMGMNDRNRKRR